MRNTPTTDRAARRIFTRARLITAGVATAVACGLGGAALTATASPDQPNTELASAVPACVLSTGPGGGPSQPPVPTTISTLEQGYYCIFAHAYLAPELDDRTLLVGAFKNLTQELERRGIDRPNATVPKFTGDRDRDWAAFAHAYQSVMDSLPNDPALREALAATTMQGMVGALNDDHSLWLGGAHPMPGQYSTGIMPIASGRPTQDIRNANPPLYIQLVQAGSPAEQAGLKPGDILVSVNGAPTAVNGQLDPGVIDYLIGGTTPSTVTITVQRPATGKTWTVTLRTAQIAPPQPPSVSVTLLDGDIADVVIPQMASGFANDALQKLAALARTTHLRGVIIDVRGNGGGSADEVATLLGAFTHHAVTGYDCDIHNNCTADHTNDSVALTHLPMVELTDGFCASACEDFSGAVKDLKLGKIVGARTAGALAGKPAAYLLNDNSALLLPSTHHMAPNGESVDQIGVAPDFNAPTTAQTVSTGQDPAIAKALSLLHA